MKEAKSSSNRTSSLEVTFVYVSPLDLFSGLGKSWHRRIDKEENVCASSSVQSHELIEPISEENDFIDFEHPQETVYSEEDSWPSESFSSASGNSDRLTQTVERDFVLFPSKETDRSTELFMKEAKSSSNRTSSLEVTFVYVSPLDLFSGLGKSWHRGIDKEENVGASSSVQSHELVEPISVENFPSKETDRSTELSMKEAKSSSNRTSSLVVPFVYPSFDVFVKLFSGMGKAWPRGIDMEENVGASSSVQSHELVEPITEENDFIASEHPQDTVDSEEDSGPSESFSSDSENSDLLTQTVERDFVLFPSKETDRRTELSMKEAKSSSNRTSSLEVPFFYVPLDLFSGLRKSWHRGIDMEENVGASSSVQYHELVEPISEENDFIAFEHPQETVDSEEDSGPSESFSSASENRDRLSQTVERDLFLDFIAFELPQETVDSEEDSGPSVSFSSASENPDRLTQTVERDLFLDFIASEHPQDTVDSEEDSGPSESFSSDSENSDLLTQTVERDFVLTQILRLACTSKPQLANDLPEIASELYRIGIISKEVRDLATNPSSLTDQNIHHILRKRMDSSKVPQFWKALLENGVESASTIQCSL